MRFEQKVSKQPAGADDPVPGPAGPGLARGVCRALFHRGYACLTEFKLASRRRVDVIGVDAGGTVLIVEVKSSIEDFRSDRKWREYLEYCDYFFFAVGENFPRAVLPQDCGVLVADPYGAAIVRDAPKLILNATRRRAQTLRFAHAAAQRLARLADPDTVLLQTPDRTRAPSAETRLL